MCSKEEKERLLIIFEGVPYSSHNDALAFTSSLITHSSSNRVKYYITKKKYTKSNPQYYLVTYSKVLLNKKLYFKCKRYLVVNFHLYVNYCTHMETKNSFNHSSMHEQGFFLACNRLSCRIY